MFKSLLLAMGAALASANYQYFWAPFLNNPNNYLDFQFGLAADAFYATTYFSADSHEEYGLSVSSTVDLTFYFEIFSFYTHTMIVHIVPLKIVPYDQQVDYTRPGSHNGQQDTFLTGVRDIEFLDIQTEHIENMKTCTASLVDTITNHNTDYLRPACTYKAKTQTDYFDLVWHYNVGNQFLSNMNWYGMQSYYSQKLY